jgi:hypothetical protein
MQYRFLTSRNLPNNFHFMADAVPNHSCRGIDYWLAHRQQSDYHTFLSERFIIGSTNAVQREPELDLIRALHIDTVVVVVGVMCGPSY